MKKKISFSQYEIYYEHMELSEAMLAVHARAACTEDTRAIFLGEEWGKLKAIYDAPQWPEINVLRVQLGQIYVTFFREPMADIGRVPDMLGNAGDGTDIESVIVNEIIQKIARKILDKVYDIEDDNE